MSFSSAQIKKLQQDIRSECVRTREIHGRQMHYIEGWHAIAEANRIFGFDAWSRETMESRCVLSRESKGAFHTVYIAKVRITVRTSETSIIREGFGTGDAQAPSAGEAHDKAIKTAETDATKRAFATFGKPFGLSLYLGSRLRSDPPPIERRRTEQRLGPSGRYYVPARPRAVIDPALKLPIPSAEASTVDEEQHLDGIASSAAVQTSELPAASDTVKSPIKESQKNEEPIAGLIPEGTKEATHAPLASTAQMLIERGTRRRDIHHLRYVAGQPCLVCSRTPTDPHHLKFAQLSALSKKVSDEFTVPLCRIHHRQLHHGGNEINWWIDMEIDPLPIAKDLWDRSHGARQSD